MPEVNLVPMMDVLMAVLTLLYSYFYDLNQSAASVTLPDIQNGAIDVKTPDPLIVALDAQGKLIIEIALFKYFLLWGALRAPHNKKYLNAGLLDESLGRQKRC